MRIAAAERSPRRASGLDNGLLAGLRTPAVPLETHHSVVKFKTYSGPQASSVTREGVATNWLDGLTQSLRSGEKAGPPQVPIRVPIFLKR